MTNPTTIAFLVGVLLGAPAGLVLAAMFSAAGRADAEHDAYACGLERGKEIGRRMAWYDAALPSEPGDREGRPAA